MTRRLPALLAALAAVVLVLLAPAPAQALDLPDLPGFPDCREAPIPEVPGRGLAGYFADAPAQLPPPGDPFTAGSGTSILEQYGYAGLRWNTYDLGCGPDATRNPDGAAGTAIANWLYNLPKTAVAATNAVVDVAFAPTFLQIFDPLVGNVSSTLHERVFTPWVPLTLAALGFLIVLRSRRAALSGTVAAVGWALLVLVVTAALFQWPLQAGRIADSSVTATLSAVNAGLNGQPTDSPRGAGAASADNLHESLLYQAWLAGMFGQATVRPR